MTDISIHRTTSQVEDRSWLLSPHGTEPGTTPSVTLDISAFTESVYYPDGYIPSGTVLRDLGTGLFGPYDLTDEVQTLTVGGSGLTSFTITFGGQTTAALAANASAASVQAALEALSSIGAGNVTVSGSAGGPWTITFTGELANQNVAQVTTTPTGGTGTVTPATTNAGGADSGQTAAGILFSSVNVRPGATRVGGARLLHGFVDAARLPFGIDANGRSDLPLIHFVNAA